MRIFALLLIAFALMSMACRPSAAPVSVSNKPISINDVPTNIPLPPTRNIETMPWETDDGKKQTLADLKGKVVILDFWATYCPPCLEGIPHFVSLQEKYKNDLVVVGLNVGGDEDKPKIPAFVEKLKVNYTLGYPDDELSSSLMRQNSAIPQTFVFDRDGKYINGFIGFNSTIKADIDAAVQQAIGKKVD